MLDADGPVAFVAPALPVALVGVVRAAALLLLCESPPTTLWNDNAALGYATHPRPPMQDCDGVARVLQAVGDEQQAALRDARKDAKGKLSGGKLSG